MSRKRSHPSNLVGARATMDEILASRARLNQTSADFLKVDVETALTFCQIARDAQNPEKRLRNRRHARQGYDTILRLLHKVTTTDEEQRHMVMKLEQLRAQLVDLGEPF